MSSIPRHLRVLLAVVAACASCAGPAAAQPETVPVLAGKAVTESNLVDALTPPEPSDVDVSGTRSLRVGAVAGAAMGAGGASPRRAGASLLITFETNSSVLTEHSKEQLEIVAQALRNERLKDFTFDIEGHADRRGNVASNMALSQQRAQSVRSFLVNRESIPDAKLRAVGKGDTEPLNTKDIAAAENRRVTIVTNAAP